MVVLLLAAGVVVGLPGCQTKGKAPERAPELRSKLLESERELSRSRELLDKYQSRYGKLPARRPKHEFRKLREGLVGKSMSAVSAKLGKPSDVFVSGNSESWDYADIAYDAASGRTVRRLEIWFKSGTVSYINASF